MVTPESVFVPGRHEPHRCERGCVWGKGSCFVANEARSGLGSGRVGDACLQGHFDFSAGGLKDNTRHRTLTTGWRHKRSVRAHEALRSRRIALDNSRPFTMQCTAPRQVDRQLPRGPRALAQPAKTGKTRDPTVLRFLSCMYMGHLAVGSDVRPFTLRPRPPTRARASTLDSWELSR